MSMSAAATSKRTQKFLFLTVSPVVFFFLHNINNYKELVLTTEVLFLFLIYSLLSLIVFAVIKGLLNLTHYQSLFLNSLIISYFLFFGALQDFLSRFQKYPILSNSFFLLVIFTLTIFLIILLSKKNKAGLIKPVKYLSLVFITFIAIEIIQIGINIYNGKTISALTRRMGSTVLAGKKITGGERPDIYHIVFDSYTNAPALKEYWGYENDIYPFLNSKGFFTIDSGFSNYTSTPYSLSSIFNLQYLEGAESYLLSNSPNFFLGQKVFINNALFEFLKKTDYSFSVFAQVQNEKLMLSTGILGVTPPTTWFRKQTMERIYLNPWIWDKIKNFGRSSNKQPTPVIKSMQQFNDYNKKALNHIFSDCKKASRHNSIQGPVFSFTHILLPHDPYLLDENGDFVKSPEPGGFNMDRYLGQLKYCNKLIQQITDCLLSDTTRKKIIIIQGDHGYRHYSSAPINTPFEALNAVYFYNKDYAGLKKNLSHVNTYRIILNKFFDDRLPLLKDSIVVMKN